MVKKIVDFAVESRLAVLVVSLGLLVWGTFALSALTIEAFPDPTDTQVQVITRHPGQPAEEMERQVSIPIERVVNGMPGLARVRSINIFGLSYVTLTFKDGIDIYFARAQTTERLRLANLPESVKPELGSVSTPIGEIFRYTLTSETDDPLELRTLQDWLVRPRLLQVEGVADVVVMGGLVREIAVHPDPVAMAAKRLTMADLAQALEGSSVNASGGVIERGTEQLVIRSQGLFNDRGDIGRVAVATRGGTPIYVSDVASVRVAWQPREGIVARAENRDAVEGIVLMRRGENPSRVLAAVRSKVAELNGQILPKGTKINVFYDRTELVDKTLSTVTRNLVEGAVLVVLVLVAFLMDFGAAMVVAALIPLSLAAAFGYLYARGMSANLLSMGSLDFGIIVDGAVVIIESIAFKMASDAAGRQPAGRVQDRVAAAVNEVARPTVFSLLIIIAAYLPIFLLERVEGRIFAPMAHTVVAALVGSLLLSVTLVPVLATYVYRKPKKHRESPLLRAALYAYVPTLRGALRRPWIVLSAAVLSLSLALGLLARLGTEFLPELNEGAMYLTFTLPGNSSLNEGRRLEPVLSAVISTYPEVESSLSQLGRPEDGTDPVLPNNLEFFVRLKPEDQWRPEFKNLGMLMESMEHTLSAVPGTDVNFSQPIRDNVNESIAGQFGQVALKIFSADLEQLQSAAGKAQTALAKVRGVADLAIVKTGEAPQLLVRPKREMLGRFDLSMQDIQSFLATALGGRDVGELWEGDRVFPITVRLAGGARETTEQLAALRLPSKSGALVPLSSVADISVEYGRAAINRENGQRYVGLRMNVRGRDLGSFVDEARRSVREALAAEQGMTVTWGGEFESKERALKRLAVVVPISLVVTFLLLFNAFRSAALAVLVLLNVPFALVGGAVGLWIFHMPVSIAAAVGFIALIGQASLNGVLVLSAIEVHRINGLPIDQAILLGASERLRPVLMTAALAALGLVPAAFSRAMGAEMQRPMAVVIVGGTISAALLTLIVLPIAYRIGVQWMLRAKELMPSLRRAPEQP
ncbi:MAG: efflux RND transporter permease subunit [Myxococcales bacterium]|nr:efflux RND transporter permease subunit [Myxococcales bacterium]